MNTQNVKTATKEPSKRWGKSPDVKVSAVYLPLMPLIDRWPLKPMTSITQKERRILCV
jgi:hypothetical protein